MVTYYEKKRRKTNLSQIEVANKLGISYDRYLLIERGKVKMPTNLIDKFNELINKGKGEHAIDKLNRKEIVEKWFDKMSQKSGWGKYKLNEKIKEFNIKNLKELGELLGYADGAFVSHALSNPKKTSYNSKEVIYSFFENELNIQPPKEKKKPKPRKQKSINEYADLYTWYKDFDINDWVKKYIAEGHSIAEMGVEAGVASNTIRAFMRKENATHATLQKVHDFITNYNKQIESQNDNVIQYTLEPVAEEDVPQEIKNSTQKLIDDIQKHGDVIGNLIYKYTSEIELIDGEIKEYEDYIKDLEHQIKEKKNTLEKLETKKNIYEELVDSLEYNVLGD